MAAEAPAPAPVPVANETISNIFATSEDIPEEYAAKCIALEKIFAAHDSFQVALQEKIRLKLAPNRLFAYGEIVPRGFIEHLLDVMTDVYKPAPDAQLTFVDLGSGPGKAVLLAAHCFPQFKRAIGIEYMSGLHRVARDFLQAAQTQLGGVASLSVPDVPPAPVHEGMEAEAAALGAVGNTAVGLYHGDFLAPPLRDVWAGADVVFTSCTVTFDAPSMKRLAEAATAQLRPGALMLTAHNALPVSEAEWQVTRMAIRCGMTWDDTCTVFAHARK